MTTNAKNLVSDEMVQKAWEAGCIGDDYGHFAIWNESQLRKAIERIAPMLAQAGDAVGEPVAWMSSGGDVSRSKLWCDERTGPNSMGPIPLYSHPPRDDGKVTGDLVHEAWLMLLNDYHARDRGEPDVSIARRVLEKSLGSIREKPVSVKKWKAPEVVGRITIPDGESGGRSEHQENDDA